MYKIIIIFLLIFIKIDCQVNTQFLIGNWTKVKTEALDGSRDLTARFSMSDYYNWEITPKKICMRNEAAYKIANNCFDYVNVDNLINTSPDSGYRIHKLDNDTLIVSQNIKGKIEKDKIQKIWFVKSSKLLNELKGKYKNDSILIATPLFTPTLNKDFMGSVATEFHKKKSFTNLIFKGDLIIDPKKKIVTFQTHDIKLKNNKTYLTIKEAAEKSFSDWNLTDFQNFEKIHIPFTVKSENTNVSGGFNFTGISIYFFLKDSADIAKVYGPKMEDLELAQKMMQKAVDHLKNKNYPKAVDFFNKGYELDPTKVDALYNIVSIYSFLKDKNNMCTTLKRLKDLEQTDGTKLYNQICIR